METLESQGKPMGAAGAASGGRSPGLAPGLGPQSLLQPEGGKNAYPGYNANILNEVNRQNQYALIQSQHLSKNRSQRQNLQHSQKRNVVYHPQINQSGPILNNALK